MAFVSRRSLVDMPEHENDQSTRTETNGEAEASGKSAFMTTMDQGVTGRTTSGRRTTTVLKTAQSSEPGRRNATSRFSQSGNPERKLKMKVDVIGNTKREKKVVPKGTFEDTINLEVLMQLKKAFKSADKDGGGDLCCEEFVRAFTGILGDNSEPDDLKMMFMKIDANGDGTVDWDEFSSYMLLQNQGKQTMLESETHAEYSEPHERMLSLEQERNQHRDMIDRILYLPAGDRWATTSRDGTIRLWSGKDLHHLRTLRCGKAWVTDLGILPRQNKLVASTFSRVLRVHDMTSLEVVGKMTELEHTPLTLDCWTHTHADEVTDRVATGDNGGFVTMYKMLERDDDDKGMETKDHWRMERLWKVSLHTDWVSKVRYMSDLNVLCSASLDRTLCLYDVERRGTPRRLVGHSKAVYSFDWSKSFKFIASCGLDRHVMLWNPFSGKSMGSLVGHSASIQDVLIIERENQIVSVGVDKVIKVWDIRNHKCLQTFIDKGYYRPENRISAAHYDQPRRQLLTASSFLKAWPLKNWDMSRSGLCHGDAVTCALYNPNFHQVISGDYSSNVCVWEAETGRMRFRFGGCHGTQKITAMSFDRDSRRLVTGAGNGILKIWNFSNGQCMKELLPPPPGDEVTAILCVQGGYQNRSVVSVGWSRKVSFWEDGKEKIQDSGRQLTGHVDDILCAALAPPSNLATGSYDGVIIIWNIDSGSIRMKLHIPELDKKLLTERAVEKLIFLKNERYAGVLASCSADRIVRFWDIVGSNGLCLEADTGHGNCLVAACSDHDNNYFVTGCSAGYIKVWDISQFTGEVCSTIEQKQLAMRELHHWHAHSLAITSIEYVPKGDMLVTSSLDCTVIMWTIKGVRVGNFGRDQWVASDPLTWAATEMESMDDVAGPEEELWTAEDCPDSDEEAERELARKKKGEDYEDDDERDGFVATPMEMYAYKKYEKAERKEAPLSHRIWIPEGNKTLNHPHTVGRAATSIGHLLHIHDLVNPIPRPETSCSMREPEKVSNSRRAATVNKISR